MLRVATAPAGSKSGYSESILIDKATSVASVQMVECLYDGSDIEGQQDVGLLRWRLAPRHLEVKCRLGGQPDFVQFGKLMYLPAGVPYAIQQLCGGDRCRNLLVRFDAEAISPLAFDIRDWGGRNLDDCYSINCGRVEATVQRLMYELENPGFAADVLIESLLTSLAVDVGRYFRRDDDARPARPNVHKLSDTQLRQITEFIYAARGGCPTSAQLATVCGINPPSFRHRFKLATGQSVHAFVEALQLERAKNLLLHTDLLMKEIAYELGFTHQATFTSSFRRLTGECPIGYRRSNLH